MFLAAPWLRPESVRCEADLCVRNIEGIYISTVVEDAMDDSFKHHCTLLDFLVVDNVVAHTP